MGNDLIQIGVGRYVPARLISEVIEADRPGGGKRVQIRIEDQHLVETWVSAETIRIALADKIPAAPHWYELHYFPGGDGGSDGFLKDAILGWAICDGSANPITIDGIDLDGAAPILSPDGQVTIVADRSFKTVEEWFEYMRKEKKE